MRVHSANDDVLVLADSIEVTGIGHLPVNSFWIATVDRTRHAATISELAAAELPLVFSTHLPPARHRGDQLLARLAEAPDLPPFIGPDQAGLEAMLAGFAPSPP